MTAQQQQKKSHIFSISRWGKKNAVDPKRRKRTETAEKKNKICMQQHNKNKADSNEKLETVANKQTSEAWKPVNFICENKIELKNQLNKKKDEINQPTGHDIE